MKKDNKMLSIGLFFIFGIVSFVALTIFFSPKMYNTKQEVRVAFTDISGIDKGMQVFLAGRAVGQVHSIENMMSYGMNDGYGSLYCYLLHLKIDSSIKLSEQDDFIIHSPKIIGDRVINIIPSAGVYNQEGDVIDKSHIFFGRYCDPVFQANQLISLIQDIVISLDKDVSKITTQVSHFIDKAVGNIESLKIINELADTLESIKLGAKSLQDCLEEKRLDKVDSLMDDLKDITHDIHTYGLLYQYSSKWKHASKRNKIIASD